jgi:hypothetical protein
MAKSTCGWREDTTMSKGINLRAVLAAYNLPESLKSAFAVLVQRPINILNN